MDLRNVAVYCKDAALYCEKDYKKNFVPLCSKCKEYILEVRERGTCNAHKLKSASHIVRLDKRAQKNWKRKDDFWPLCTSYKLAGVKSIA